MTERILPGAPDIQIQIRRSARARRYSLRVSRLDGRVTLTLPSRASEAKAMAFAREKAEWIRVRLADMPVPVVPEVGAIIPVEGVPFRVSRGGRSQIVHEQARIEISNRVSIIPAAVSGLLRTLARDRLAIASDGYAGALGRRYTTLTLRDTRSRWGSCSSQGALMYSWRLVMAPVEVLDYVAAHEVAHLAEMNHGPRFWATVERLMPDYRDHRAWLRRNGEDLHRYRFGD